MTRIGDTVRDLQVRCYDDPSLNTAIRPFGHNYPWQLYTRWRKLQLTAKLEASYPVAELKSELDLILSRYAPARQSGYYHLGGWTAIGLHTVNGDPLEDKDWRNAVLKKTPALQLAPTMEAIIDSIPGEKRRVRLMQLSPAKTIFWHTDHSQTMDRRWVRLHVPIVTNPDVSFQISHSDCPWQPGELWYGDFSFPHRLQNGGTSARVHLVMDIENNPELQTLLPDELHRQREVRMKIRHHCLLSLKLWHRAFATGRRLSLLEQQQTT